MRWLRALAFNIAFFAVTGLLGVAGLPLGLLPHCLDKRAASEYALVSRVGLSAPAQGLHGLPAAETADEPASL